VMRGVPVRTIGFASRCEPTFLGYVAWEESRSRNSLRHRLAKFGLLASKEKASSFN